MPDHSILQTFDPASISWPTPACLQAAAAFRREAQGIGNRSGICGRKPRSRDTHPDRGLALASIYFSPKAILQVSALPLGIFSHKARRPCKSAGLFSGDNSRNRDSLFVSGHGSTRKRYRHICNSCRSCPVPSASSRSREPVLPRLQHPGFFRLHLCDSPAQPVVDEVAGHVFEMQTYLRRMPAINKIGIHPPSLPARTLGHGNEILGFDNT